ncbi:MAG: DUF433 domain-containing protein [Acidobacteria bacterium]|nr:DUF433 domain-containing protein [Acidobacteriota bacterium]
MTKDFVELRSGSFYVAASRVPLAHLVREFQAGESPESIRAHYPTLTLEQVYGAIAFYLGHREAVEADLVAREREEDAHILSQSGSMTLISPLTTLVSR